MAFNVFNVFCSCIIIGLLFAILSTLFVLCCFNPKRKSFYNVAGIIILSAGIALLGFVFAPPSEHINGGDDEGMYVNFAIHLAKSGRYTVDQPLLGVVTPALLEKIAQNLPGGAVRDTAHGVTWPVSQMGLVLDQRNSRLLPLFPPGYPLMLASFYQVAGFKGIQSANLFFLVVAGCLASLLAGRWGGLLVGWATLLVYLLFPLHIWIASTFLAEAFLQMLILMVFWLFSFRSRDPHIHGVTIGLLTGFMLTVKLDSLFLLVFVLIFSVQLFKSERQFAVALLISLLLSSFLSLVLLSAWNPAYFISHFYSLQSADYTIVVVLLCLISLTIYYSDFIYQILRPYIWHLRIAVFLFMSMALIYGLFIRPYGTDFDTFYYWPSESFIRSYREQSLLRLSWYWTPVGFLFPCIGMLLIYWNLRSRTQYMFYLLGIISLIILCYDIHNYPLQPYAMRRFLPYVTPLMVVSSLLFWRQLKNFGVSLRYIRFAPLILALFFVVIFWPTNVMLSLAARQDSLTRQLDVLANYLNPSSLILMRGSVSPLDLALPLQLIHNQNVIVLSPKATPSDVDDLIKISHSKGYSVYAIGDSSPSKWVSPRLFAIPVTIVHMEVFVDYFVNSLTELKFLHGSRRLSFSVYQQSANRRRPENQAISYPSAVP